MTDTLLEQTIRWLALLERRVDDLVEPEVISNAAGGRGVTPQVAYWTGTKTIGGDPGLTYDAANDALSMLSTISTEPILELQNTNVDALSGSIQFYKNSAAPADGDDLGAIEFYGETSTGAKERYAYMLAESDDITNGDTAGRFRLMMTMDAVERNMLDVDMYNGVVNQGTITFNTEGQDVDYYVESVGVADALFIRGSDGQITFGAYGPGYIYADGAGVLSAVVAPAPTPHAILSASHSDSVANAVNRGSLIYGNATPAWDELNHPGGANRVLQSSAADVQWSAQTLVLTTSLTNQGANGVLAWGGAFTLTIPATGTAVLGTGAANTLSYWSGINTQTNLANAAGYLNNNGAGVLTWVAAPAPAAHNLLSASHGDSVANAVNRGSLVYGNATPAWDELNHPVAANRVLQSSAADVQWSAQTLVLTTSLTNQGANGVLNWGGAFTLTIPASGTAVLGTGANTRVAYWTGVNTVSGDAGFTYNSGTDSITLGGDIILTGGGAANIVILDNQLDALGIEDAGGLEYLMICTNDTQPAVRFNDDGVDVDFYVEAVGHADALFIRGSDGQFTVGALGAGFVRSDAGGVLSSSALIAGDLPAHTHSGAGQGGSLVIGTTDTDATAGSVLFAGAAGVIQQDNANLFWDDGNNYLGLGTAAPNERLEVNHNANAFVGIRMDNPNAGNAAASSFYALNDTNGSLSFGKLGSGNITHTGYGAPNDTFIHSSVTGGANLNIINAFATGNVAFYVGNTVAGGAATMILDGTNKRLGIGDATPDAPLDVYHATTDIVAFFESGDDIGGIEVKDDTTTGYLYAADGYVFIGGDAAKAATNMVVNATTGYVGIGTTVPLVPLHIQANDLTVVLADLAAGVPFVVEGTDGLMELVGEDDGTWLGGISITEMNAGALTGKWGILTQTTTAGDAGLHFTYGAGANPWVNTDLITFTTTGRVGIGDTTPDASLDAQTSDAVTAAITDVAILAHDTSGTAAVGFGAGLLYQLEDVGTTLRDAGRLAFQWEVAATATRRSRFVLHTCQTAGSLIEQGVVEAPTTATVAANSRGAGAVDWQGLRSAGAQVASGAHSVISGGRYNTASGDYSTIIGGGSSIAIGDYSMAMGYQANAALQGAVAHASGAFATAGDVQHIRLMAWRQVVHSNTSWYTLYLDGAAALMTIPADTIWRFQVRIGGTTQGGGAGMDVWGYGITGLIENDNGTTTLLASVVTTNYEDDANFDARALADDPNDALLIQVQDAGASGVSVRWGATLHITQVTYP